MGCWRPFRELRETDMKWEGRTHDSELNTKHTVRRVP